MTSEPTDADASDAPTGSPPRWSVAGFQAFWNEPDPSAVGNAVTVETIGHWPGRDEPVRGRASYVACIAAIVRMLPDMRLEVAETPAAVT
jgi:hypothetical protein